jgi:hypothetical protein
MVSRGLIGLSQPASINSSRQMITGVFMGWSCRLVSSLLPESKQYPNQYGTRSSFANQASKGAEDSEMGRCWKRSAGRFAGNGWP